jgi:hypothetical protein
MSDCPLESPPVEGVTISTQTHPLVEDETPFHYMKCLGKNKNMVIGLDGT